MRRNRLPLWQSTLWTIGLFWAMALILFVAGQWALPALLGNGQPSPTSGFNYTKAFMPIVTQLTFWMAIVLVALGPIAALVSAMDRLGDRLGDRLAPRPSQRARRR